MKRRKFLGISAAGAGLVASGSSLYGDPLFQMSALQKSGALSNRALEDNKMRLAFSRMELPVEAWEPVMNMSRLWTSVLASPKTRREFRKSPRKFLHDNGVPREIIRKNKDSFKLLKLISDPYVRHLASSGSYSAFIRKLQESNILQENAQSSLRARVKTLLNTDIERFRSAVQSATRDVAGREVSLQDTADLYAVTQQLAVLNGSAQAVAVVAVFVVAAALVLVVVTIGVAVTVGTGVGLATSIAVFSSVFASGCDSCHADFGKLANLEPKMRQNLETVIRAARLTGQKSFEVEALRDYITVESQACLEAAEDLAVISLPRQKKARQELFRGVARLTCDAAGLS